MLIRFCLYGFLKNQRYYEPFLFLALRDKGLSFTEIGFLLAIEGITVNVLEVPSGAAADLFGRRRSLYLSFGAYLASMLVFGLAGSYAALCGAMVLFAVGESFRSGTHKAMIFAWLELEGRSTEKTRVYGVTRSWSKTGSAVSALLAAALVYATASYQALFFWSMVPCALSLANLLGYPAAIDATSGAPVSMGAVVAHLRQGLGAVVGRRGLRRLIVESMGFHGLFRATKDYLQPALVVAAVAWFGAEAGHLDDKRSTALLVGPVYALLSAAAAVASRHAHRFAASAGGEARAARSLWVCLAALFAGLALGSVFEVSVVMIAGFILLSVLQNLWRPILTSRIFDEVDKRQGATVLSIESQGHRLGLVMFAPLFGFLVDSAGGAFWPAASVAALVCGVFLVRA